MAERVSLNHPPREDFATAADVAPSELRPFLVSLLRGRD